jgi:predicted ATP-grasp superfamily ATP-dependent carboligase
MKRATMPKVLVTDAVSRNALAAVRALGYAGYEVWAAGTSFLDQAFHSRYCRHRVVYPDPAKDYEKFVDFMLDFLGKKPFDVLLPFSDYETIFVTRYREELPSYVHVPAPDYQAVERALSKPDVLQLAKEVGIDTPLTYLPRSCAGLEEISNMVSYPCVIKPKRGACAKGVRYAQSAEQLMTRYWENSLKSDRVFDHDFPMVQEYIPGMIHDVCLLFNHGEPIAGLTTKRVKMYPVTGGRGILNETTDEPHLMEKAIALLKKLEWHGPGQVEFKVDSRDGTARLMEVNGRFWGTLDVAIQAGLDIPSMACRIAMGEKVPPVFKYEVGLQYRWIFPYELAYVATTKNKLQALREFFRFNARTRFDIQFSDPLPFAALLGSTVARIIRRTIAA